MFSASANNGLVDSLKTELKKKSHDTIKIDLYYHLAGQMIYKDMELADKYVDTALNLSIKNDFANGMGQGFAWKAYIDHQKGDIGAAIDWNLKSLKIIREQGYENEFAPILNNLATLHIELENYHQAKDYYEQCVELNKNNKSLKSLGANYNNLALVYKNLDDWDQAMTYYGKSETIRREIHDSIGLGATYSNMGTLFEYKDSLNKALYYYQKSLQIRENKSDMKGIGICNYKIASILLKQKNVTEALSYANSSYNLCRKLKYKTIERDVTKVLYRIFKEQSNSSKALYYFELHQRLNDSLNSIENKRKLIESEFKFEYNQKHVIDSIHNEKILLQNEVLEKENKIKSNTLSLQQLWIGIIALALITSIIILVLFRKRSKTNEELLRAEIKNRLNDVVALQQELEEQKKQPNSTTQKVNFVLQEKLSEREQEVLDLLVLGMSNKEIAEKLFLSVNTIKSHINSLYVKLDVNNRTQAAIKGSRLQAQ